MMPKYSISSARAFDSGVAALAALSAGFVAFAMPQPLFSGLVEASRLPDLVAAARPPLGDTARFAAVGAAALFAFASVWVLMTLLGRAPVRTAPVVEAEAPSEAPRVRRADAHPDAPARRPLLARDLGEPLDLEHFPEAPAEDPAPALSEHRPLPPFLVPQAPEAEPAEFASEAWEEPRPAETAREAWEEPEPLWTPPQPDPVEIRPAPSIDAEPRPIADLAARLPEGEEEPDQPLSQLVNRIEFGLSRKRQALPAADLPTVEQVADEPEKIGHRLRSAINDLQKIASTGG